MFQAHCYSENLAGLGIEPGTSGSADVIKREIFYTDSNRITVVLNTVYLFID
jgi:hypothetical protein